MNYIAIPGLKFKDIQKSRMDRMEEVINSVARYCNLTNVEIKKVTRKRNVVEARYICFYILNIFLRINKVAVGKQFGQDHTTVIHGVNTCINLLDTDPEFKAQFINIQASLQLNDNAPA